MAGLSNLVSAGGCRPAAQAVADIDGDVTPLFTGRLCVPAACGEHSGSGTLDVPLGVNVVAARFSVNTSLSSATGAVRVRLDGPVRFTPSPSWPQRPRASRRSARTRAARPAPRFRPARARQRHEDSLLVGGQPVGNNASPGNAPAPAGVSIGTNPDCNSTTDILNDSMCRLGAPVATEAPGAGDFLASTDDATPTSGSGVDVYVTRVPERDSRVTSVTLGAHVAGRTLIAVSVMAASADLPAPVVAVAP